MGINEMIDITKQFHYGNPFVPCQVQRQASIPHRPQYHLHVSF